MRRAGNPAHRTGRVDDDAILRLVKNLTLHGPEGMLREGLGLWDAEVASAESISQSLRQAQRIIPA
ncbi:MAG: hypothetical protein LBV00_02305 [Propionibacteriaceae bacterium]|jgi:hypothetical protein|nr:hypothetical protein [Propionibacteriaceae bacterium]